MAKSSTLMKESKCGIENKLRSCLSDNPVDVFGTHLREQVEERLKFYETGEAPKKNAEVMKEALEEVCVINVLNGQHIKQEFFKKYIPLYDTFPVELQAEVLQTKLAKKEKKKKKKEKKRKLEESANAQVNGDTTLGNEFSSTY